MRVLAVPEDLATFVQEREHGRKSRGAGPLPMPCEVAGDQIVIAGRMLKHLRGQLLPECGCHRTGFERV